MKKKIFVNIVLFLELVMFLIYGISLKFTNALDNIIPFNYVIAAGAWCHAKLDWVVDLIRIKDLFNMLLGTNLHFVAVLVALIAVNIAWIIVFYIIFGTIGAISKASKRKKRRKLIPEYKLTPSEQKHFVPANYKKKSGKWVGWTMIIPILFIALFILARFDVNNIASWEPTINKNGFDIYSKYVLPVLDSILHPIKFNDLFKVLFVNEAGWGYINLINKYLSSYAWVEFVVLPVASILILFVWWGFFKLISLIFRGCEARHRCNKAKKAHIEKMEKIEYKLRKKYKDDAVAKGDEFLRIIEEEQIEDAKEIAKIKEEKSKRHQKKIDARKKAYLEEIGYGVVDLGVSNEQTKDSKEPIVEREIRYISDADVDIILDEEPVIEVVEEDDMEEVELSNKEDDLFFEKYHDDDVDLELVEENKSEPQDVMDYVKEKAEEKEETPIVEETPVEEETIVEEYVEEKVEEPVEEETPVVEEKVEEPVVEETPKKNDPFAAYRNRVNKGHGAKKVQTFKEAGFKEDEMMVRDDGVKVSIKYDPFAKWRNQERKKGYGAKKVPSFKEIQAQKELEAKKLEEAKASKKAVSSAPKKANPFEQYKNKPKGSTAAKKVPPKKETTPVVEEPKKEETPKKNDPFAAYRNKPRASTAAKKVPPKAK